MSIRVIDYLESRGVDYKSGGKNVGTSDVNINCVFCGEESGHLGINRDDGRLNCWICGLEGFDKRPNFAKLISEIEGCSYGQAVSILKEFSDDDGEGYTPEETRPKWCNLPDFTYSFTNTNSPGQRRKALDYLGKRGYSEATTKRYDLKFCISGKYSGRIIVPVYLDRKLVTFLGRDYTGKSSMRYKNCPRPMSIVPHSETLYGIDSFMGDHLRLVEGVTDVWRIGNTSVAAFGSKLSKRQLSMIIALGLKSVSMVMDGDAYAKAYKIAEDLSPFVDTIKVLDLGDRDPSARTREELLDIESNSPRMEF